MEQIYIYSHLAFYIFVTFYLLKFIFYNILLLLISIQACQFSGSKTAIKVEKDSPEADRQNALFIGAIESKNFKRTDKYKPIPMLMQQDSDKKTLSSYLYYFVVLKTL